MPGCRAARSCSSTRPGAAWFSNDGNLFFFRHYDGPADTLLYHFFIANFKVQLGYYKKMEISDNLPVNLMLKNPLLFFQDFVAPFFKFIRSEYKIFYDSIDNEVLASRIRLVSSASNFLAGKEISTVRYGMEIDNTGISVLSIEKDGKKIIAKRCSENQ